MDSDLARGVARLATREVRQGKSITLTAKSDSMLTVYTRSRPVVKCYFLGVGPDCREGCSPAPWGKCDAWTRGVTETA